MVRAGEVLTMATTKTTTAPMTGFAYCVAGGMIGTALAALAGGVWFVLRWCDLFAKLAI